MGKGGKYLRRKSVSAKAKKSKVKNVLLPFLIILLVLILAVVGVIIWIFGLMPDENEVTYTTEPVIAATTEATAAAEVTDEATIGTTSPEETWPEVKSDKNITNIMLVGQAAREGEEARIADTMILCSINRETKTLTMTSLMRDLRLVWPEYVDVNGVKHTGNNRINMAYNMGYKWDGNVSGGMNVLESIVEYNFGVEVDHSVEINFEVFEQVMEMFDRITVTLSEEEIKYLQENYPMSETGKTLVPGENKLSPYLALGYARMRKVGHGDFERTERQRTVITQLLGQMKDMNILELLKLIKLVMPNITTNMSEMEMLNYAYEFIPMLKDLKIQSQRIPFDDTYWSIQVEIDGQQDYQIQCNVEKNAELLQQSLGLIGQEIE